MGKHPNDIAVDSIGILINDLQQFSAVIASLPRRLDNRCAVANQRHIEGDLKNLYRSFAFAVSEVAEIGGGKHAKASYAIIDALADVHGDTIGASWDKLAAEVDAASTSQREVA